MGKDFLAFSKIPHDGCRILGCDAKYFARAGLACEGMFVSPLTVNCSFVFTEKEEMALKKKMHYANKCILVSLNM